jgi:hypothetical protein
MGRALLILKTPQVREKAMDWIRRAPVGTRVEFKASKRSLPQNDLLWALLTDVQAQMKARSVDYSTDQWKVILLHAWGREVEFLPSLSGDTFIPYGQSSSDLSKEEMTDFIEFIISEAAKRDIVLRIPNTESSDATPAPGRSDEDDAPRPEQSSSEPEGSTVPPPSGSQSSTVGKFDFAEGELQHLIDFAAKGMKEARTGTSAGSKLQFLGSMHLQYRDAMKSSDALIALDKMNEAMEGVMKGERDADRIEAWMTSKFFTEINENG